MGKRNIPISSDDESAILALRAKGFSFREIGHNVGRCYETVRQVLLRHHHAGQTQLETHSEDIVSDLDITGARICLPPGHPVIMRGLWRGLEHRRPKQLRGDGWF